MMQHEAVNQRPRLGVCSWSLQPSGPQDLARKVEECGVWAVQLALDPLRDGRWNERETVEALGERGIEIVSGMMATVGEDYSTIESIRLTGGLRADAHREENLRAAHANAEVAARLGIPLVTFHAGFLPHDREDAEYATMIGRIRSVAEAFMKGGVPRVALETGQESAETLTQVLTDLRVPVGVNFDPGNMILYGMGDPVEALRMLVPWIGQVHIKDALPTTLAGEWGSEVRAGMGAVRWDEFFTCISGSQLDSDLLIEREAGGTRIDDIRAAAALVRTHCPRLREAAHG